MAGHQVTERLSDEQVSKWARVPEHTSAGYSPEHVQLAREVQDARRWKAEALQVLGGWEQVWIAAGEPGALGSSKYEATLAWVQDMRALLNGGPCPTCEGTGCLQPDLELDDVDLSEVDEDCEDCDGTGRVAGVIEQLEATYIYAAQDSSDAPIVLAANLAAVIADLREAVGHD